MEEFRNRGRKMGSLTPPDALAFLLLETPRRPMHMSSVQVFAPPPGSGPEFVRETYAALRGCKDVAPLFAGHPVAMRGRSVVVGWTYDDDVDLDYHLRYTSLPQPGGTDELNELLSHLHSEVLDRRRPLWEVHVIDGLDDGRFVVFIKAHHALLDGVAYLKLLRRSLTTDRDCREIQPIWAQRSQPRPPSLALRRSLRHRLINTVGALRRSVTLIRAASREHELFPAFRGPHTILNVASDVPWVCAAKSWPIARIDDVKDAAGASVNDVALAMCAGALRALLSERTALPDRPLVALVPVGLRTKDDVESRNLMSIGVCNLATHLQDPAKRLDAIAASMRYNKHLLRALPRQVAIHLGGVISASPRFTVGISHIADAYLDDAADALHLNGARLDGLHGFPPLLRGHALNFGLTSNAVSLTFGIVGCARVVPSHDRLIKLLEVALQELEGAFGL